MQTLTTTAATTTAATTAATTHRIINKGSGAGGARTNLFGKAFESKTNNEARLIDMGFERGFLNKKGVAKINNHFDYLSKKIDDDKTIIYCTQHGLKHYIKQEYDILLDRLPDEAYIVKSNTGQSKTVLKILEKKAQNVSGSVIDKLFNGPTFREVEYQMVLGDNFDVKYAYCVSEYLKKQINSEKSERYKRLKNYYIKQDIPFLYGDDANYFETLDAWIYS